MKTKWLTTSGIVFFTVCMSVAICEEPPKTDSKKSEAVSEAVKEIPVTVEVARDQAKLMHEIYVATLEVIHDRYFHGERAIVPARAMEDIFFVIQRKTKAEARWISVNAKAMSVNHKPQNDFEKLAAREIAKGKEVVESISEGYYRRAGAIPLNTNCIGCHAGLFSAQSKKPKFAGLVISIPIQTDAAKNVATPKK